MKKFLTISLVAVMAGAAYAHPMDVIGGPDGSTQTVHHCGFLAPSAQLYTTSPVTIRIIESKLIELGYYHGRADGLYGKSQKQAVKLFQADQGLKPTGIVNGTTAQHLAYATNPSPNVRRCYRVADASFR